MFRTYFSGDWDVQWGYGLLTHGHLSCSLSGLAKPSLKTSFAYYENGLPVVGKTAFPKVCGQVSGCPVVTIPFGQGKFMATKKERRSLQGRPP